jgi:hypothetical protein
MESLVCKADLYKPNPSAGILAPVFSIKVGSAMFGRLLAQAKDGAGFVWSWDGKKQKLKTAADLSVMPHTSILLLLPNVTKVGK